VNYPFNLIFLGNRNRVIQGLLTSGLVLSVYDFTHTHVTVPSVWFDCVYDGFISFLEVVS